MNSIFPCKPMLQFPSQRKIAAYLEKHRLTNGSYLKDEKIIETVAKLFANQSKAPIDIDIAVTATMDFLNNRKLGLSFNGLTAIKFNLILALIECANRWKLSSKFLTRQ